MSPRSQRFGFLRRHYRILLPIGSVAFFLGFSEIACRVFHLSDRLDASFKFEILGADNDFRHSFNVEDANLLWRPLANFSDERLSINSAGFRDREFDRRKDPHTFRILCLGDSTTFGLNLALDDLYPKVLEKALQRAYDPGGTKMEVIDGGVTGYSSLQGLVFYQKIGVRYQPDLVTFYFGVNDPALRPDGSDASMLHLKAPSLLKALENRVLLKSEFWLVFRKLAGLIQYKLYHQPAFGVVRVSKQEYEQNILELDRLCRENGARLVLISPAFNNLFVQSNNPQTEQIARYREVLHRVAREHQIPLLVIPEMIEEKGMNDHYQFFRDAVHPNEEGHALIANRLLEWLKENRLLPS